MIISIMSPTSRQVVTLTEAISSDRELTFQPSSATKTPFSEMFKSRVAAMNEYRSIHIDAKDVIAFISLEIKDAYDSRH